MPGLTIGDAIPNLEVSSTRGTLKLADYIKGSWAVIFSYPADFAVKTHADELEKRGVKLVGVSCEFLNTTTAPDYAITAFPVVSDPARSVIQDLNMVDPESRHWSGLPAPSRALHVVGPDGLVKLCILHPAGTPRDVDEVVRVVDSLQRTAMFQVATPVNWKKGEPVVISPSVTKEDADRMFPQGYRVVDLPSKKHYLRFTKLDE